MFGSFRACLEPLLLLASSRLACSQGQSSKVFPSFVAAHLTPHSSSSGRPIWWRWRSIANCGSLNHQRERSIWWWGRMIRVVVEANSLVGKVDSSTMTGWFSGKRGRFSNGLAIHARARASKANLAYAVLASIFLPRQTSLSGKRARRGTTKRLGLLGEARRVASMGSTMCYIIFY